MFCFSRKVQPRQGHSDEWNDGYQAGYNEALWKMHEDMQATISFHNSYAQMLERELGYLREKMKKYREDYPDDCCDGCDKTQQ